MVTQRGMAVASMVVMFGLVACGDGDPAATGSATLKASEGVATRRMVSTERAFSAAATRRMPARSRESFSVSANSRCASGRG